MLYFSLIFGNFTSRRGRRRRPRAPRCRRPPRRGSRRCRRQGPLQIWVSQLFSPFFQDKKNLDVFFFPQHSEEGGCF